MNETTAPEAKAPSGRARGGLPTGFTLRVKPGDKVSAGLTVLAELNKGDRTNGEA